MKNNRQSQNKFFTVPNWLDIEAKWQDWWKLEKIYNFDPTSDKPVYSIDTPPPTISGELHVGHAMSYGQAEFIARYRRMRGFNVFYPMGFDDNGLPTERYVEKKKGVIVKDVPRDKFIRICLEETAKAIERYKTVWDKLGISVDWNYAYSTIDNLCRRTSQKSFLDLYKQGRAYRKKDVALWCPTCETAIAQAELEMKDKISKLNYLLFGLENGNNLEIATSRPELLGGCVAIAVNPGDDRYKPVLGQKAIVPIYNHEVEIRPNSEVNPNFGTGAVMICTFGDKSDVELWKKYNLPLREILGPKGRLTSLAGKYANLDVNKAREKLLEELLQEKKLTKQEPLTQIIGVHEKCDSEVEYLVKDQWFIKFLDLKEQFLAQGDKIRFFPEEMRQRYVQWVKNLDWDWCISRQRAYGIPIPVWYCSHCGDIKIPAEEDLPIDPLVNIPKETCKCGSDKFAPETDIFDTWMTSSLTPLINSKWVENTSLSDKIYPMSLRPQAHEIIRTWTFYTIVKSYLHTNNIPWQDIMISGHGLDSQGKKMSKSKGNVVDPLEVISRYSADALRWWAAGVKLGENLPYQEKDVISGKLFINKLWNAAKFSAPHLEEIVRDGKSAYEFEDKWILDRMNQLIKECTSAFENYQYSVAKSKVETFFRHDVCDNYLEMIKSRLYGDENTRSLKISAQKTLYTLLLNSIKLLAPFIPHVTEELYQTLFRNKEGCRSIHLSQWPESSQEYEFSDTRGIGKICLDLLHAIRKWKTERNIRLGEELPRLVIEHPNKEEVVTLKETLTRTLRIKNLEIIANENFSIHS